MDTWAPKDVDVPYTSGASMDGSTFFLGQQVAYVFINGYAIPREVASLPKSQQFPVGYFELTNLKGTSPYATDLSAWQDNGGPTQSFQYGIASSKADRTMTPAKIQAATAWLQFISSPKWDSLIVNAEGNDLPIIKGATASPQLQPILNQLNSESKYYYPMALFDSLTSSSFQEIDGLYLEYVDGLHLLGDGLVGVRHRCCVDHQVLQRAASPVGGGDDRLREQGARGEVGMAVVASPLGQRWSRGFLGGTGLCDRPPRL